MASEQLVQSGESITAAIEAAAPGARIIVAPGLYRESVRIDKPVELLGDGSGGTVELWPPEGSCLDVRCDQTIIRGLKVHGRSRAPVVQALYMMLLMEDCVIEGGAPAVALSGRDTVLKRCLITGGKTGLHIGTGVDIEIEDCSIVGNDGPGVVLAEGQPTLKNCRIYENEGPGVLFAQSSGTLKGCSIHHNEGGGLVVDRHSDPNIL